MSLSDVRSRPLAEPNPSYYDLAVAASAPPPPDEICAARARPGRGLVRGKWSRSCQLALAAAWSLAAAGCADRSLTLVGRSTMRDDLVGLWHFDETTGAMAVDSSGRGNHGTLTHFADLSSVWVPGKFGNALAVNAGGWVAVPVSPSIDSIASGVTVSAWVSFDETLGNDNDFGTAISRQINGSIDQYFHLSLHNAEGTPSLFITPVSTSYQLLAGKGVPRNTWIHLAGTYDEVNAILYVNGEMAGPPKPVTGRFVTDGTPVILGGNANQGLGVTELFPGRIDEITLYSRALTAPEIEQLAQAPVM